MGEIYPFRRAGVELEWPYFTVIRGVDEFIYQINNRNRKQEEDRKQNKKMYMNITWNEWFSRSISSSHPWPRILGNMWPNESRGGRNSLVVPASIAYSLGVGECHCSSTAWLYKLLLTQLISLNSANNNYNFTSLKKILKTCEWDFIKYDKH